MYLNGGWVKGYFNSRGWVPGKDYGAFLAPGTSNDFGLVVDSFVVPRGSSNAEMGIRWAHMCTDPDLQLAFTSLKGSISPYSDTPDSVYDPITLQFKKDLLNKDVLVYPSIAHGMALPWSTLMTLHSLISDFTSRSNPDVARHARNITQAVRESGIKEVWHFDF
jgi:glucose/mannose transport system substrate-binding protein